MARREGRPVARVPAFWDASALVPLCVRQTLTARAISLYEAYDVVVWWATPVEVASALARLMRMQHLDTKELASALKLAKRLSAQCSVIQPSGRLRTTATQLVDRYDLRAADSLQLSAALEWCEGAPQDRLFLTADQKLRDAALLAGFDAKQL